MIENKFNQNKYAQFLNDVMAWVDRVEIFPQCKLNNDFGWVLCETYLELM